MSFFIPDRIVKKVFLLCLLVGLFLGGGAVGKLKDQGKLRVNFFDVGEGDAILIQLPSSQEEILIDGGPDQKILEKISALLPFWDRAIETIVITHPHADHITGLAEVIKNYQVGRIYYSGVFYPSQTYLALLEEIKKKNIPLIEITAPQKIDLGRGVVLNFLYPYEQLRGKEVFNLNNTSLVSKITYNRFSALLMGDAEEEVEEILLEKKADLSSTIIKLAHHGSANATSLSFLKAVLPQAAVISVGKNNDYHLPSRRVIKRLQRQGIKVYRTDEDGDVRVVSNGESFEIKKEF